MRYRDAAIYNEHALSNAVNAARGAAWLIVTSFAARIVGMISTVAMTHFLTKADVGEVSAAAILAMSAGWIATWGFGPYVVVHGRDEHAREVAFHATVAYLGLGVVALGVVSVFAGSFSGWLDAPNASVFVPGMAISIMIRRVGAVPERILTRRGQFRAVGMASAIGEVTYAGLAVALAASGVGAASIVIANIVQSTVTVGLILSACGFAEWARPVKLRAARIRHMLRFGLPLAVESLAHNASRDWDNLMVSHIFGAGPTGAYNLAYNLADIPAVQVGEQLAHVLLPSMASLPPERRPAALERATALLSLIIFPMAVGLGLVAQPLVSVALPPSWSEVAPLLAILATLSIFRPITWVLSAYMEAQDRTARLMFLEVGKLIVLLGLMALLSPLGLRWSASAVGVAYALMVVAGVATVSREGVSPWRLAVSFVQPLAACAVMGMAVLGLEAALPIHPAALLPIAIVVGAGVYVGAALVLCRSTTRDMLNLVKQMIRRRTAT